MRNSGKFSTLRESLVKFPIYIILFNNSFILFNSKVSELFCFSFFELVILRISQSFLHRDLQWNKTLKSPIELIFYTTIEILANILISNIFSFSFLAINAFVIFFCHFAVFQNVILGAFWTCLQPFIVLGLMVVFTALKTACNLYVVIPIAHVPTNFECSP